MPLSALQGLFPVLDPVDDVAITAWNEHATRDRRTLPGRPLSVLFVGVPLSGKSHLARHAAAATPAATLHVENDTLRERIAHALGQDAPTHDPRENHLTYRTAWTLMGFGLDATHHVLHDGTNLTERGRRGAYAVADARGAPTVVVFVVTPREVLDARAALVPPTRQEAYLKLGRKQPDPDACTRPHIVVDGAKTVEENLARLRDVADLAALFTP